MPDPKPNLTKNKIAIGFFIAVAILLLVVINLKFSSRNNISSQLSPVPGRPEIESLQVCTSPVNLGDCYQDSFPKPVLSWQCEDKRQVKGEYGLELEIDDKADFSSPELKIKESKWSSESYRITESVLKDNTDYYWRLRVQNNSGIWSDWAEHEEPFNTGFPCAE